MPTETPTANFTEFLSRKELASRWRVCSETIRRREREGVLHPVKMGRTRLYRIAEINKIEENNQ